jgi:hypothetical protein
MPSSFNVEPKAKTSVAVVANEVRGPAATVGCGSKPPQFLDSRLRLNVKRLRLTFFQWEQHRAYFSVFSVVHLLHD